MPAPVAQVVNRNKQHIGRGDRGRTLKEHSNSAQEDYGFKEASLVNAGFNQLDLDSNQLIIPNYFSPFVRENKKIYFFIDSENRDKVKICKADGDQDRPS